MTLSIPQTRHLKSQESIDQIKADHVNDMGELRGKIEAVVTINNELKLEAESHKIKIHVLEKRLEDQTNRSSRKSLVFKGVPEKGRETWDDTRDILADVIARNCDMTNNEAFDTIERCHRSAFQQQNKKKGKRNIYCAFHSWDDAQYVLERFRRACMSGRNNGIYVEQRYGAATTARRNNALVIRKGLKADGTITSGYISYPAKLMVKYNVNDKKFSLHEDFSDIEVNVLMGNEADGE